MLYSVDNDLLVLVMDDEVAVGVSRLAQMSGVNQRALGDTAVELHRRSHGHY